MALSNDELYAKASFLAQDIDDNFLDLGKTLRQLMDRDPDLFQQVWQKSNLGRRKAYYLVEISRTYDNIPGSRARLKAIGWTKLQIIGKFVTKDNVEDLLALAESMNSKQLSAHMRGEKPVANAHCVLMYFSPKQYQDLEAALIKQGAVRAPGGRGMQGKEEALIKLVRKSMKDGDQA